MTLDRTQLLVNKDEVCRLYKVWAELPADKPRKSLDPLRLGARLLPHLALLRALPDDFRYDLIGESVGDLGRDLRPGRTAAALHRSPSRSNVWRLMRSVAASRQPGAQFCAFDSPNGARHRCFAMALPLSMDKSAAEDLLLGLWTLPSKSHEEDGSEVEVVDSIPELVDTLRRDRRPVPSHSMRRIALGAESIASR